MGVKRMRTLRGEFEGGDRGIYYEDEAELNKSNQIGYSVQTFFGGLVFAAGACILSGYLIARLIAIYSGKEHVYNTYEFSYSEE